MNLATRKRAEFGLQDRRRGQEYFDQGRVSIIHSGRNGIDAVVEGSRGNEYQVELVRGSDGDLDMCCDCPRFHDGYNCKHLYATLLAVDASAASTRNGPPTPAGRRWGSSPPVQAGWKGGLSKLRESLSLEFEEGDVRMVGELVCSKPARCWYVISLSDSVVSGCLHLRVYHSERVSDGTWSVPTIQCASAARQWVDLEDKRILEILDGPDDDAYEWRDERLGGASYLLPQPLAHDLLARMAATERLVWVLNSSRQLTNFSTVRWDDGPPWRLVLRVDRSGGDNGHAALTLAGRLEREGETVELADLVMAFNEGLVLLPDRIGRLPESDAPWISAFMKNDPIEFPAADSDEFFASLAQLPMLPHVELDPSLRVSEVLGQPRGRLELTTTKSWTGIELAAKVLFAYQGQLISPEVNSHALWCPESQQLIRRNFELEIELLDQLSPYGFTTKRPHHADFSHALWLDSERLPSIATELVGRGWEVVVDHKLTRSGGRFQVQVNSHQDWFDVDARVDFDGMSVTVPQLLVALRSRTRFITLDDGSQGMLPQEWLARMQKLADIADGNGDSLRVHRTRALMIDALLADQPDVCVQRDFTDLCRKMREFSGIKPAPTPRGFKGKLRKYQSEGVAWFGFLREFGFGGCLADDMGLGKTVQVLALLLSRCTRTLADGRVRQPSLVVVPKSLVFNWIAEANRFAPKLRIVNHTGTQRAPVPEALAEADVLLTTYGTLRSDIELLSQQQFDYAVLDEAQAIKNPESQTAKACGLIRAEHRLAMTGTPVENHLGELWSLMDFLNPGMFGASRCRTMSQTREPDAETCELLRQSLRPFILRRTKEQVLKELPKKFEETIFCEMTAKQQRLYDELRNYYRAQLTKRIDKLGIQKAKIYVLEALLRLRQAACDPRLLEGRRTAGVKLQILCERLEQVMDEGHKVLVFSQFTSLLALLRQDLDARGWVYEYLDGKTRQRGDRVRRFQEDSDCRLFLISLKAGGHGLNLTAADYVFILDPWWNPAVEAQAIDRAHRIGQKRQVMAYRIICRNSVEEKIIALQESKRELADAIITANQSLIRRLTIDDLQLLLT